MAEAEAVAVTVVEAVAVAEAVAVTVVKAVAEAVAVAKTAVAVVVLTPCLTLSRYSVRSRWGDIGQVLLF